jgi:hypothetical protein
VGSAVFSLSLQAGARTRLLQSVQCHVHNENAWFLVLITKRFKLVTAEYETKRETLLRVGPGVTARVNGCEEGCGCVQATTLLSETAVLLRTLP